MSELITLKDAERTARRQGRRLFFLGIDEITPSLSSAALVKGLLGEGGMSVIFGEPNCGKTFFALDIALHVAMGAPWCGRKTIEGAVIYLAAEGGHSIKNRVAAFRQAKTIAPGTPFFIIPCAADLREAKADTDEIVRMIGEISESCDMPARLLVVDTLARVMAGGNENSPDDMGKVIANLDRIREQTKAHCCIIHHSGKDVSRGERGHSSLRGAIDTAIEITSDGNGSSLAKVTKQRDLPNEGEFAFSLPRVELGMDEDGEPVTSCVVEHRDAPEAPRSGKRITTAAAKVAFAMLQKAIEAQGQPAPQSDHIPSFARCVSVSVWRGYCDQGSVSRSDKPDSRTKAFKRASEQLQGSGHIGVWNEMVWAI